MAFSLCAFSPVAHTNSLIMRNTRQFRCQAQSHPCRPGPPVRRSRARSRSAGRLSGSGRAPAARRAARLLDTFGYPGLVPAPGAAAAARFSWSLAPANLCALDRSCRLGLRAPAGRLQPPPRRDPGTGLSVGAELDGGHGGAQGPPERVHRGALSPVPKRGKDRAATGLKAAPVPWMRGLRAALGAPRTGVRKRAVSGLLSLSRGSKLLALPFQGFPRALPSGKTAHIPMKKWRLHLLKWASNSLRLVPLLRFPRICS